MSCWLRSWGDSEPVGMKVGMGGGGLFLLLFLDFRGHMLHCGTLELGNIRFGYEYRTSLIVAIIVKWI